MFKNIAAAKLVNCQYSRRNIISTQTNYALVAVHCTMCQWLVQNYFPKYSQSLQGMMKESITWVHDGTVEISNHETQTSSNRKLQTISPSPWVGLNDELLGHSSGQSFLRYIFNVLFILESGKNQCRNQNFLDKKCLHTTTTSRYHVLNHVRVAGRSQTLHVVRSQATQ